MTDAKIYPKELMSQKRDMRILSEKCCHTLSPLDGLELMLAARLFWVEYVRSLASFQMAILSKSLSAQSRPQATSVIKY